MPEPRFSVVLPTRNRARRLQRAVQSVLHQTCADWELCVVNDASTDDTLRVLGGLSDPRIRIITLPENRGVGAARNTGIRMLSGELVSFLDDDDEFETRFLERTLEAFRSPGWGLTWTGVTFVHEEGSDERCEERTWLPQAGEPGSGMKRLECDLVSIGLSYGVTVRRDVLEALGGLDESLRVAQDTDFFLRFLASGRSFSPIPEVLVRHHMHSDARLTGREHDRLRLHALRTIMDRHRKTIQENPLMLEILTRAEKKLEARMNG